jgi:hypothetical protein
MTAFIYGGIALCTGVLGLLPFDRVTVAKPGGPEIVAIQGERDPHFKELDEISGVALAGFRDEKGAPLLWGHEEKTSRLILIRTRPADTLYAGAVVMAGPETRDAEDIAVVHGNGRGTIYLEDAGANRKDMAACVRYAREDDNPALCSVADSVLLEGDTREHAEHKRLKHECRARGEDWIFLDETDHLDPGEHPEIRRMPEPSYKDALRGTLVTQAATIQFDYPQMCGDRPCLSYPGNKLTDIAATYNTEALAVIAEPDRSHTAYLFTKAHRSLAHLLHEQHHAAGTCTFETDGLSDVFRLPNIDTLPPGRVHQAEYVATLDLGTDASASGGGEMARVTAANFLPLSASQGLLLVRTTGHAYKWAVRLGNEEQAGGRSGVFFDVAGALRNLKPLAAAVPATNDDEGVGVRNQEAAAQVDESAIYYMGECKDLPKCAVALIHDNHPYLAGDVDGNGRIDESDLVALDGFLKGGRALYCRAAADVNGDNRITRADLAYLKDYLGDDGPAPVARDKLAHPGLSCGYYNPQARR